MTTITGRYASNVSCLFPKSNIKTSKRCVWKDTSKPEMIKPLVKNDGFPCREKDNILSCSVYLFRSKIILKKTSSNFFSLYASIVNYDHVKSFRLTILRSRKGMEKSSQQKREVYNQWNHIGCFLKWWYPQNTLKWSFLVGKLMVVGYHHFRNPPNI